VPVRPVMRGGVWAGELDAEAEMVKMGAMTGVV